jgi:cell division initiation protein
MPDQSSAATEHAILQEITGPLQALPDDPLSVVNADFPVALRGYDRDAVDGYVQRTRQLVAELQATRSPEAAVRRALERVGEEITGILQRAHETAEQITAQSRSDAEDRLEQARQEAAHIVAGAQQRVRDLDADADRIWLERQRIVGDAEELAAQLQALATSASERFPADPDAGTAAAGDYDEDEEETRPQQAPVAGEEPYHDAEAGSADQAGDDATDVEETVAFEPMPRSPQGTSETGEDPTDEHPSPETRPAEASEDTTAVIRPASQAASRRLNQ